MGVRRKQVDTQTAGAHQNEATRTVRVVERKANSSATTERIAQQINATGDLERVQEIVERRRTVNEVLRMLRRLVGLPVTGLIDRDDVKALRQHRNVAGEVRPRRRAWATAVQQHDGLVVSDARLVEVQFQIGAHLREP